MCIRDSGYTVARIVTDDGEPVTVVGCIPCAAPGEELILTGRYTCLLYTSYLYKD